MRYQTVPDLTMTFEHDGRVLARALARGVGARLPVQALPLLHFARNPCTRAEVAAQLGPGMAGLFDGLVDAELLVPEAEATQSTAMFEGFARVDVHARMLSDGPRLAAYEAAINEVVEPGQIVVDAGTGTGILALFASRAGAAAVLGVEASDLASLAQEIFAANSVDGQVLQGDFASVATGPADVVVTETFGALAYAEGAAADVAALVKRCGASRVIPSAIEIWVAPALDESLKRRVLGPFEEQPFDFSPLTSFGMRVGHTLDCRGAALGSPQRISHRAFPEHGACVGSLAFPGDESPVGGLVAWFRLVLSESVGLDTAPDAEPTHWKQVYLPWDVACAAEKGTLQLDIHPDPADRRGLEVEARWESGRVWTWRVR